MKWHPPASTLFLQGHCLTTKASPSEPLEWTLYNQRTVSCSVPMFLSSFRVWQMKSASFVNIGLLAGEHPKAMCFLKLLSGVSSDEGTLPCASNFVFAFHSPQSECPQFASGTHISHGTLALVFMDVPLRLIWTDCLRKKSPDTFTMALKPPSYPCHLQKEWCCLWSVSHTLLLRSSRDIQPSLSMRGAGFSKTV